MDDLAIVIVSIPEQPGWLPPCLRSVRRHVGDIRLDVVVVDNGETGEAARLVEREFPDVRALRCENRGFGHANNRGLDTCDARHVLFLNPDTEVLEGSFDELVAAMDGRPRLGVAGMRQVLPDGTTYPTARRPPSALRLLVPEALPVLGRRLGERELRMERYSREFACGWVTGSAMLVRRRALDAAGPFDERFFLYSEEADLCLRIRRTGFEVAHLPTMTIVHHVHAGAALSPRMEAQLAWARVQYARKHFGTAQRLAFEAALRARYAAGAALARGERRAARRLALATVTGREPPPFARLQGGDGGG